MFLTKKSTTAPFPVGIFNADNTRLRLAEISPAEGSIGKHLTDFGSLQC